MPTKVFEPYKRPGRPGFLLRFWHPALKRQVVKGLSTNSETKAKKIAKEIEDICELRSWTIEDLSRLPPIELFNAIKNMEPTSVRLFFGDESPVFTLRNRHTPDADAHFRLSVIQQCLVLLEILHSSKERIVVCEYVFKLVGINSEKQSYIDDLKLLHSSLEALYNQLEGLEKTESIDTAKLSGQVIRATKRLESLALKRQVLTPEFISIHFSALQNIEMFLTKLESNLGQRGGG